MYKHVNFSQYSLGLFDCNEMVTQNVIMLLKELSKKYVPTDDTAEIVEELFLEVTWKEICK